ncbi:hypothetical protein Tco_0386179 [Tanacetum coccineum]
MTRRVLPSVLDVYAIVVSGMPGDGSRVHTPDHDGSEAPNEAPDSILSSEPKPLGKHRPPREARPFLLYPYGLSGESFLSPYVSRVPL